MSNPERVSASELATSSITHEMSPGQVAILADLTHLRSFHDEDKIIDDGDDTNSLVVILSGRAQVQGAFDQQINVIETGAVIGELSFLDGKARSATVRSLGDSRCAFLPRDALQHLKSSHPDVLAYLLFNVSLALCQKLRSATRMVNALSTAY